MANENLRQSYVVLPADQALWVVLQVAEMLAPSNKSEALTVIVRELPEGVFLGTSDDLPGLIVEADSRDELIDIARSMAAELLELEGLSPDRRITFYFDQ